MNNINLTDEDEESSAPKRQIAVALSYEQESRKAPIVTAKGYGTIAEQILNLAFTNGVKVREDAELAEILSLIDIDSPIPLEAYVAVAEILTHVYKANSLAKQRRTGESND